MKKILLLLVFAFISQITTAQDALSFDAASSERVLLLDNATTDQMEGATNYTIEAWVKPTSTDIHGNVIMKLWGKFAVTMFNNDERRLYFTHYDGATDYVNTKKNVLTINAWNHIAVICNSVANTIKIYVNGVDVTDDTETAADVVLAGVDATDNFYVAYGGSGTYADIDVREVRVKFVAESIASLNTTDVTNTYATDANTAILLHFTDGSGATTANTAGGAAAALNNTPTWITTDTNTWTGGFDTSWVDGSNWSAGAPPLATTDVIIPDLANQPDTGSNVSFKTMSIRSDASVTVTGTITNTGAITIDSGGSLIADNAVSGDVTYKRSLGTTNWYLISSPVSGESVVDFVTNNATALGSGTGTSQNKAVASYDNTQAVSTDRWAYYTVGQTDGIGGDDTADTFAAGQGFTTKLTASSNITFTGTMNVADVPRAITIGAGDAFNLIGNPYPSFMNSGTGGFLPDNTARLTSQTLWVWDQGSDAYIAKVTIDDFKLAPGQGFFVECGSAGDVTFQEADQSHQATDTFLRSPNSRPEVHLFMTDGTSTKFAKIYYINGTTIGFDNGYDGELFGGVSNPFAVYTHLVSDSQGKDYQIQSLPDSNYENMVIPVGVNATSGTEITFRADVLNMPAGMDVYLENRTANTFTKLTDNGTYTLTLNADSNGIGQFYLRTSSSALGVENVLLDNVSIYKTNNSMLRVAGLQQGNASLKVVNLLGKQVFRKSFATNGVSDISLSKLATGIYIVQLQTENGKLNKKIIIE